MVVAFDWSDKKNWAMGKLGKFHWSKSWENFVSAKKLAGFELARKKVGRSLNPANKSWESESTPILISWESAKLKVGKLPYTDTSNLFVIRFWSVLETRKLQQKLKYQMCISNAIGMALVLWLPTNKVTHFQQYPSPHLARSVSQNSNSCLMAIFWDSRCTHRRTWSVRNF